MISDADMTSLLFFSFSFLLFSSPFLLLFFFFFSPSFFSLSSFSKPYLDPTMDWHFYRCRYRNVSKRGVITWIFFFLIPRESRFCRLRTTREGEKERKRKKEGKKEKERKRKKERERKKERDDNIGLFFSPNKCTIVFAQKAYANMRFCCQIERKKKKVFFLTWKKEKKIEIEPTTVISFYFPLPLSIETQM